MSRRLPDGTYTNNTKVYVEAWRTLASPIELATGTTLTAFDPDLVLRDTNGHTNVALPAWFAIKLYQAIRDGV